MKKRIQWIDVAKGLLIILVALGHCSVGSLISLFINSFHMAAFFLLSGITFNKKDDWVTFTRKKVISLLIPYIVFSAIMLLYSFVKSVVLSGSNFDLLSGITSVFVPISGRTGTTVYGLWFLPCLFLAEEVEYILYHMFRKSRSASILLFGGFSILCILVHRITGKISVLSVLPFATAFLILGLWIKKYLVFLNEQKNWILLISTAVLLSTTVLNYSLTGHGFDLSSLTIGKWPIYFISSIAGSLMICCISMLAENISLLSILGRDSLYYYGLHYELIAIVERCVPTAIVQSIVIITLLYPVILILKKVRKCV